MGVEVAAASKVRGGAHIDRIVEQRAREPKVGDLHEALGIQQQVGRLQVAVNELRRMDVSAMRIARSRSVSRSV